MKRLDKDDVKARQRPFIYRIIYGRMGDAAVLMDCIWKSFFDRLGNHIIPFVRNDLMSSSFNRRVDIDFVLSQRKGKETAEFCRLVFIMLLFLTATEFLQSE